ncbi:ABC transporter permease [Paraburkholderia guartelaensis]|jgi:D-methionine transport system permease protein|uniref:ABC transporter permease n=1 Tax=Paraburkholderia guartelaensis TaxID=2546446 RepID=A0A4V2ZVP5_9BURK|nr:methionine ABC transporter permease [Paraburkholderia guartelaensis]TDG06003.1 ABC transporter permease [Paraburkholderia guartelaensis]
MSPTLLDRYAQALLQTLLMVGASMLIAIVAGMLLAIVLTLTAPRGLYPRPLLHKTLSTAINMFRAIPFIILLVALLPVTRFIVGTTLGAWAAVVPLSANLIPFFARIVQVNLGGVEPGLIEAARAMGCKRSQIVHHVLLPEALPGILGGVTVTAIAMIDMSAMAGAVGGGGLGDMAIRYGYERYETQVMIVVIFILVALVSVIQLVGEYFARRVDRKH